jgi:hypothetical protein
MTALRTALIAFLAAAGPAMAQATDAHLPPLHPAEMSQRNAEIRASEILMRGNPEDMAQYGALQSTLHQARSMNRPAPPAGMIPPSAIRLPAGVEAPPPSISPIPR